MASAHQKRVDITESMLAQLARLAGAAVLADDIVVFEATAAGTRPLSQRGGMYDGAVITSTTLAEMALSVNSGAQAVPLHVMHNASYELPVGRVFKADVVSSGDGQQELRTHFYLPKTEAELIEKIELGVLDEVSIGFLSKHAMCSECAFDYFAAGNLSHLYNRTCDKDHTIGFDGAHLVLAGVDMFSELSLVSRGASANAKIHGRARQSSPGQERLAAAGLSPNAAFLQSTPTHQKEPAMADPTFAAELAAALTPLTTSIATLTASAASKDAEIAALTAQVEALTAAEVVSAQTIVTLTAEKAAQVASALTASALPVGGASGGLATDVTSVPLGVSAAFRSPK